MPLPLSHNYIRKVPRSCPVRAPSVPRPCPVRAPSVPRPCPARRVPVHVRVCAYGRLRTFVCGGSPFFAALGLGGRHRILRVDGRAARGFSAALSLVGRAYRIFCGWTGAQRAASLEIAFAGPSARLALREAAPAWPPRSCGRLPLPGRHARARPYLVATLVPKAFPNVLSKVTGRGTCLLPSHCRRCRLRTSH